jgi:hypothetical protein
MATSMPALFLGNSLTSSLRARRLQDECVRIEDMGRVSQAVSLEERAADDVEAAVSAMNRDNSPFSIGLLLDAAEKERESLDQIEADWETLRDSLAQRRSAIDQQQEMLRDLAHVLTKTNGLKH